MLDVEMMQETMKLEQLYENRWEKQVDFVALPSNLGQHKLLLIMRLIVDTGDSVLVGYRKIRDLLKSYYKYLDTLDKFNNDSNVVKNVHYVTAMLNYTE